MNNRSPGGLQDDEALLAYLTGGKESLRWQVVYTRFRAIQVEGMEAAKFAKAFATWLDDLKDGHFTQPLQHSLYTTFLAYLDRDGNEKIPSYVAGDSLTLALDKDRKNAHDALVKTYHEPAKAILNQRQPIPGTDFADAYQNAQLNLLEKPPAADQPLTAQLFSWFMRVLIRRVVDWQRKQGKSSDWISPEDVQSTLPEQNAPTYDVAYWDALNDRYQINQRFGDDDAGKVVSKALGQMEDGCRDLIRKRYIFNYAYKKIAEQNDYSVDSVGQRIKRCLKKLRQVMTGTSV